MFSGDDPYVGIDLDGCLDPETGQLAAWAARIVTLLDSYTEISPSGRGVHIFVCGVIPGPRRRVGPVEMYSSGRYFTVTGRRLPGTRAEIAERTAELATIYSETFGSGLADEEGPRVISSSLSDDDLVRRAGEASNGEKFRSLWSGDTTGYLSHSEADLALCGILVHWTGRDPNRIDALFRSSGLMRRKWDERRGGATYGEMTIDRALHRADGGQRSRVGFPLTQYGNAERLVAHHGRDLRYLPALRQWLVWDGTRWRPDETGEIVRRAKDTVRRIYEEAGAEPDDDARKALARWAQRSEAESAIKAMIGLAESEPGVSVTANALDADCWALNVANGTLDLRTGVLRPHRREDLITKLAPVAYDAGARSERWETFLQRVLPDAELRAFVQRAAGYSLAGAPTEEVLLFVHGPSRTGKSTFIEALRSAFGDYAVVADFEAFVKRRNVGGPRNDVARLAGARLVVSIEVEDGQQLATALVKGLTGGDRITARYLYKEAFEFTPQFTLWIAANHRPRIP
ncbi:MAG: phage/plasmid primase, P4 family, partial [Planctomycetota bacterium]|nr:phage/plasmid primase, P4 family [Planctomycetota bacterium]